MSRISFGMVFGVENRSWRPFGGALGAFWEVWGRLGELLGEFGGTEGGSWEDLGSSLDLLWGGLGGLGGHSGVFLDDLGDIGCFFWGK